MANHSDAMKRIRQNETRRTRNRHYKSMMRTKTKQLRAAISSGDTETATAMFPQTVSLINRLASKGIIHKNQAARRVSRLQLLWNKTYPAQESTEGSSFYKQINGVKYSRKLIEWAEGAVAGQGDGRISTEEAKELFEFLSSDNRYSDLEKKTIKYIRENYNWTDAADSFLRDTIRKWAAQRSQK